MSTPRKIKHIINPQFVMEGAGVLLRRSISPNVTNLFDPFLLFDHFAFNDPTQGNNPGFPMHPHRGIETVTYILDGSVQHRDSLGNAGIIGPGDVQWMTSGRGILHEEMPKAGPDGGIHGFQLWVNLPAAKKMSQPRYQEVKSTTIPTIVKDGAEIRVVAGNVLGVTGPVTEIAANPIYLDVNLEPGAEFGYEVPTEHTLVAYVFEGAGSFGSQKVEAVNLVQFTEGDSFSARANPDTSFRFMLMAGAPFREPIAPYGPFVMNTMQEIQQAIIDLRTGRFVSQ